MENLSDLHDLQRFVIAQDEGGTYERALAELRAGRKTSHWMWFVFPQIAGLGQSAMSQRYAIESLEEARAYLDHPVLGPRLVECARALLTHEGLTAHENWWPDVYRQACAGWGIEPDPKVLAFAETYEAQRADLKTVSGSA